jgi:rare lipoprotein A
MFSRRILQAFYQHPVDHYFSNVIQVPTVLMSPPASSSRRKRKAAEPAAQRGRVAVTFAIALTFLASMVWDAIENRCASALATTVQADSDSGTIVLSLAALSAQPVATDEASHPEIADQAIFGEACDATTVAALSPFETRSAESEPGSHPTIPQLRNDILDVIRNASTGARTGSADLISLARNKVLPTFGSAYRSVLKLAALTGLPRIQSEAALNKAMIMGTVSTYNPYRDGPEEGGTLTASGELYDPVAWTAAVQTDLREQFGGVRYGKLYQPKFALVESGDKQLIVRVNDVGRLKPGRVLDLNERSMRYFDPFLSRGLIEDVRITLLPGEDWMPGPIGGVQMFSLASTTD